MNSMSPPIDRRDLLKLASGLALSFAVPGLDARGAARRGAEREKSLIIVWLDGGPSQLETWDPHPGTAIGGPTKSIPTTIPGVEIADAFPQVADQLQHLSVIRSLVSKEGDHERAMHFVRTGYRPDPTVMHPSLGSIVTRELPAAGLEIPQFISLGFNQFPSRGGYLGGKYDAFLVQNPEAGAKARQVAEDRRYQARLKNLEVATRSFERGRGAAARRTLFRDSLDAAVRMLTSEQIRAFDVADEPQVLRDAYGPAQVGRACLVARRLIEQGVRVVEATHHNYDTHENNFSTNRTLAGELDPALATLVRDLVERDLLESTLVLCLGEFGRTPHINRKEGRDHWPGGFSCLVGGAGLAHGIVLGATDPTGERKSPDQPIEIPDLCATVLETIGVDITRSVVTPIGRPMRFSEGTPIDALQPG
jgi:hypothetical protein